jgi:hypothetical protein
LTTSKTKRLNLLTRRVFADLHTHTSRTGAELNAECVVAGLKALAGNPLGRYLSDKGNEVAPDSGH